MEHLILMAAGFIDTISFRKIHRTCSRKKDVRASEEALKRRAIKASHGACTAKLCKAVFGNTVFTASSVADVESVKMWMFIWLNEEVAKCCSLLHPTTWHVYFRHFCAAISRWTWMLKLSPLNLRAWQVMMMGRQHLHWLLCSKMKMRDG